MDFLYLSPEFPPNYAQFIHQLNHHGVNVWGLGESDFYDMPAELRADLKWYERADMNSQDSVDAALVRLIETRAGRLDVVESHNEHWMRLEAFINRKYGLDGIRPEDLTRLKQKSAMKREFVVCGLPVARSVLVADTDDCRRLAAEWGYPVILKPDEGVGAGGIHKITDGKQLDDIKVGKGYLLEEFIEAPIVTYDGLTDRSGQIVFENSLSYGDGVLEYVRGKDPFFYVERHLPPKLVATGRQLVKHFNIRRKFFHFEFFRIDDRYLPIEINCRPPGGSILDMMNYSADVNLYAAYAAVVARARVALTGDKKYYCGYIGRRDRNYTLSHTDVVGLCGAHLAEHGLNPAIYQAAMGRYRYIIRFESRSDLMQVAWDILRSA